MEAKETKTRKKGGLIAAGAALLAVIIIIILLLTQCNGQGGGSTAAGSELARLLAEPGDKVITLDEDVVISEPLVIVGNKTIEGTGTIVLDTALEGAWPENTAPAWGMGCVKLEVADTSAMPAMLQLEEGAALTLGGSVVIDAGSNANGISLGESGVLTVNGSAVVKNGRYANLVVAESATANLVGGQLLDGAVHNVVNYGVVDLTGTGISGAASGAAIYTTGSVMQSGGSVESAAYHNVYVAAGTYEMSGGINNGAAKDGLVVAEGAKANVTGGDITNCVHGLCNNGTMDSGAITLSECGIMNYATGTLNIQDTTVDVSEVYSLANSGGTVVANNFTAKKCDTTAVYNFSGDMTLNDLTVTGGRDGNISNAGGNMTVNGATLDKCRDKSITVGNGKAVFNDVQILGTTNEKYGIYTFGGELVMNDCSVENVSSTAVKADSGSTVELNNVTIKDCEQNGFQLDGGKIVATNVSMTNMGSHGIYNNGGNVVGTNITIDTVKKNGVQHKYGSTTLDGVTITGTGNHGAYVEDGTLTISNGALTNMAANGFYLPEGEAELVLDNVSISGTVQQGINNSASVDAKNVTISDTGMNAIYNKVGGVVTVDGLKVSDVAEHGINNKAVMTASNVTISNTGAGSNGIQNNGTMALTTASVENSKNHGLYNTGSLTAANVTINGTAKNGVYNAEQGNAEIDGLSVSATGEHGINNAAKLTASDVKISATGAGKNGVQNSGTAKLVDCQISDSKNHGIYNTGNLSGSDVTITGTQGNGLYNNGGTVNAINGLNITNVKDQGVNNTGSFTASNVVISGTGKNGVYNNKGTATITGLTVTNPGEHGVSNDYNGVVTLKNATLDGSAEGKNGIQNKATMTVVDSVIKNSKNHGIYNDSDFTATGSLTVTDSAVNGVYNYGGTMDIVTLTVKTTKGGSADSHGVNNTGTVKVGTLEISNAYANGIQNKGEMEVTGSAKITDSGKHGLYNGSVFEGKNITITNAGDLLVNNGGDMVIHGLDLSGTAHKAIYNAAYAELYSVCVDGSKVTNGGSAEYLIDNNGGVLDLEDATVLKASGTALHNRGNAHANLTNVILDHAGNYGIFVEGGSTVSGDGVVVNNVKKGTAVSGAEGIAVKNAGKITMMDHLTIGDYDEAVTGCGIAIDKSTTGIPNNNALVMDAATATFSGYDLTIRNASAGSAIYNKGITYVTDLTVSDCKQGVYTRYNSAMTLSGTVAISDLTDYAMRIQGDESSKGYKNSITLTQGTKLTIENVGGHGIYNGGTFESLSAETITITKPGGNGIQSGAGAGVIEIAGNVVITEPAGHGIYNAGRLETGSVTVTDPGKKGINNAGTVTVNGDFTVTSPGEEGIVVGGGKTMTVTGTIDISDSTAEGITVKGTLNSDTVRGNIKIDTTGSGKQGLYLQDGSAKVYAKDIAISNAGGNGIYINNKNGKLDATGTVTISGAKGGHGLSTLGAVTANAVKVSNTTNSGSNGIYLNGGSAKITAVNVTVEGVTGGNGIYINNGSGQVIATGELKVTGVTGGHGISTKGKINSASAAGKITVDGCKSGSVGLNLIEHVAQVYATDISVKNSGGHGIVVEARVYRDASTPTSNTNDSIKRSLLSASGNVTVEKSAANGIYVLGQMNVAGNVKVTGSGQNGVALGSAKVYDKDNTSAVLKNGSNDVTRTVAVVNVTGTLTIEDCGQNGINTNSGGSVTTGGTTIKNIKNGNSGITNGGGGKHTVNGDLLIDGVAGNKGSSKADRAGNGVSFNNGSLTVSGNMTVKNITATVTSNSDANSVNSGVYANSNATITVGGTLAVGNDSGKVTNYGIFSKGDLTANAIVVNGTKNSGISTEGVSATSYKKLHANSIQISNTDKVALYTKYTDVAGVTANTKIGRVVICNVAGQGYQVQHENNVQINQLIIANTSNNALRLYGNKPTVDITEMVAYNITQYAVNASQSVNNANLLIGKLYYSQCGSGMKHGNVNANCITASETDTAQFPQYAKDLLAQLSAATAAATAEPASTPTQETPVETTADTTA